LQEQRLQLDAQAEALEHTAHASIAGDRVRPIGRIGQEPRIDRAKEIDVAIFVIAELVTPYSGVFVVSPAPLADALKSVEDAITPAGGRR
jgi:hypothetical protein